MISEEGNSTIEYYNNNTVDYELMTSSLDMSALYMKFQNYLSEKSYILDLGCGTGRDANHFLRVGYKVDALDASEKMCKLAARNRQINVRMMKFDELDDINKYDAVWACASLLHVPYDNLGNAIYKIEKALKPNGILYVSFKYGNFEGYRDSKYYTDMTEIRFKEITSRSGLILMEQWISEDISTRRNVKWFNVILRKG